MDFNLQDSIVLLSRTPSTLNSLLRDLPNTWTNAHEGENTWTPIDVVAHLLYTDRTNWMPRAKTILEFGESKPFDPFRRFGHVDGQEGKSLPQLLDQFAQLRAETLNEIHTWNLNAEDLAKRGQHPALGTATLSQLIAAWTVHDLTHLHQIARILAHQYREAVGPWNKFLGVLQCNGHSVPA
jgi:DinB superfamily